jgi:TPP-dependent pyruvate/acetoin dehydrogenase alpha subunit
MTSRTSAIAELARSLPADKGFALIPNRKLFQLYALMLHSRLLDEQLARLAAKKGGFGPFTRTAGAEASLVAATVDLVRGDTLAPGTGALTPCFLKGLPLSSLRTLAATGKARIGWLRYGIVPPTLALEEQLELVLAAAEADKTAKSNKAAKNKKISVVFCGDPAANTKLLKKALQRAGRAKLPILFVANSAAESEEFAPIASKYGFPGIVVDASDAVAVYRVVTESSAHARRGNGPTLIECRPWPLASTVTDPLDPMEQALRRRGIFTAKLKTQTKAIFKRQFAEQ